VFALSRVIGGDKTDTRGPRESVRAHATGVCTLGEMWRRGRGEEEAKEQVILLVQLYHDDFTSR
jgi:hypothetical protein